MSPNFDFVGFRMLPKRSLVWRLETSNAHKPKKRQKNSDVRDGQLFSASIGHPQRGSNNSVSVDCLLSVRV